jgi:hypothetical protein
MWTHGYDQITIDAMEYDKQDQQGKAVFNERNPQTT